VPRDFVLQFSKLKAQEIVKMYDRRFTIEETFRDTKDLHFGMVLRATHIREADRRDRLLLLVAMGHTLLTLLGACGMDAYLKVNTVRKRTHSLLRQGLYWTRACHDARRLARTPHHRLRRDRPQVYVVQPVFALPGPLPEAANWGDASCLHRIEAKGFETAFSSSSAFPPATS
jgi:hypothetical protein